MEGGGGSVTLPAQIYISTAQVIHTHTHTHVHTHVYTHVYIHVHTYGLDTISSLLKIIGLFCRI